MNDPATIEKVDKELEELFNNFSLTLIEQGYVEDLLTVVQKLYWQKMGSFKNE